MAKSTCDDSSLQKALQNVKLTSNELLQIEGAGAYILINRQRILCPWLTGATRTSIRSHYTEISPNRITDEIGPETNYAPNIEYGIKDKPNYPKQPFVRPAAVEGLREVISVIGTTTGEVIKRRWT